MFQQSDSVPIIATGVVDTGGAPCLQIFPQIFEKIRNDPYDTVPLNGLHKCLSEKVLRFWALKNF
jgi:hypothetical protein